VKRCECGCGNPTPKATKTDSRRGQKRGEPMRFLPNHSSNNGPSRGVSNIGLAAPELDALSIMRLRSLSDQEAADALDSRLRALERAYKRSFVERGLILLEMEERVLWGKLTDSETGEAYTSFERWIVSAATHSRSDCFAALKAVKELRDIPTDQLLDMPRCNVSLLQSLSGAVRKRPEVVKAAQTKSAKEFVRHIEEKFPEQHIESIRSVPMPKGDAEELEQAIGMAMKIEGVTTRSDALRCLAINYIQDHQVEYDQLEAG
jgi:hypothetical protein